MTETPNGPAGTDAPYALGAWVPPKEDKDPRRYRMSHFLEEEAPKTAVFYNPGPILDQGQTSSCVGHAGRGYELMDPNPYTPGPKDGPPATLDTSIPAIELYRGSQDNDPWPGSEWEEPKYEGSSLSGLAKYMQAKGLIKGGYAWAQSPNDVTNWLRLVGPIIFASLWTREMFTPDQKGFLHVTGSLEGGHAYRLFGIDSDDNWWMVNQWKEGWGLRNQTFTDKLGRRFTVRGGIAKIAPSEQPKLFAARDAEGFSPVKVGGTTPPAPKELPTKSLNRFVLSGATERTGITKAGQRWAIAEPWTND